MQRLVVALVVMNQVALLVEAWTCPFKREDLPSMAEMSASDTREEALAKIRKLLGILDKRNPYVVWTVFKENVNLLSCARQRDPSRILVTIDAFDTGYWPGGVVPYQLNQTAFSPEEYTKIMTGIKYINDKTCVKFVPYNNQPHYVRIDRIDGIHASASTGFHPDFDDHFIELHDTYFAEHGILMILMNLLGFKREHHRHDRDKYINIVKVGESPTGFGAYLYRKNAHSPIDTMFDYDYDSVTHMTQKEAQHLGLQLTAKMGNHFHIDEHKLSRTDLRKIYQMYNCTGDSSQVSLEPEPEPGPLGPDGTPIIGTLPGSPRGRPLGGRGPRRKGSSRRRNRKIRRKYRPSSSCRITPYSTAAAISFQVYMLKLIYAIY